MDFTSSDTYETNACHIWKSNNNQVIHIYKKLHGYHPNCWIGRRGLPLGIYRVSFNIKANKHIPAKHNCGLKLHYPHDRVYNYFLPSLRVNEINYIEQYVHIHSNDLINIIFDNFDEDLHVEISNLKIQNMKQDITIILQGKINPNVNEIDTIKHYLNYGKIIASSYYDSCPTYYWDIDRENIHFIMNDQIGIENELRNSGHFTNDRWTDNAYYQLKTTENALKDTNSPFIVKTRIDTFFSYMGDFLEVMLSNQHRITTSSLYVRGYHRIKYHMSDILFGGAASKIREVVRFALEKYPFNRCPEVLIWAPYILTHFKRDICDCEEYVLEMAKLFVVFPLNWNNGSYNFRGIGHLNDTPKCTEEYLRHGCEC
jgi:hypothetical protein